jgi:hypothetical protein
VDREILSQSEWGNTDRHGRTWTCTNGETVLSLKVRAGPCPSVLPSYARPDRRRSGPERRSLRWRHSSVEATSLRSTTGLACSSGWIMDP